MSDREIKDYLKSRYSEFILYRPEVNKNTWLLWGSPVLVVLLGGLILARLRRQAKPMVAKGRDTMANDQRRLNAMLGDEDNRP